MKRACGRMKHEVICCADYEAVAAQPLEICQSRKKKHTEGIRGPFCPKDSDFSIVVRSSKILMPLPASKSEYQLPTGMWQAALPPRVVRYRKILMPLPASKSEYQLPTGECL